jgi:hypothetical protein
MFQLPRNPTNARGCPMKKSALAGTVVELVGEGLPGGVGGN